jgi:putative Mn2+ efflux pump MntP
MDLLSIFLIAFGLSLDAFAVAISSGLTIKPVKLRDALTIALFFGSFQFFMPILGGLAGTGLRGLITKLDHWVALALLIAVGGRMIYESARGEKREKTFDPRRLPVLFILAVATSIDSLAVGLSLSFLKIAILRPALVIGIWTFGFSFLGVYIGKKVGKFFERGMELIGGLILIGIGIRILIEHLR